MEKFLSLPIEKQNVILDAAFAAFGRNGYKKASINDIAEAAGISKAMIFYYFGSKKKMYLYLIDFGANTIRCEMREKFDNNITDFFDRIIMFTEVKTAVMKKYRSLASFMTSFYYETDPEVESEKKKRITEWAKNNEQFTFGSMDKSKFKDDIAPDLVYKFLIWAAEGFAAGLSSDASVESFDSFTNDFYECIDMMKKYFYK